MTGTNEHSIEGLPQSGRRRVLLGFPPGERALDLIFELAEAWAWDLIGYEHLEGSIPDDLALHGALIKALPASPLAEELHRRDCPTVRLGRLPHPQDPQVPVVLPDQVAAGRMAAEHFVERRFKELAIVTYNASVPTMRSHALWSAFRERVQELGMRCHSHDFMLPEEAAITGDERFALRSKRLAAWMAEIPKPVGIFTIGDDMADMICRMCAREQIRVPEEVAVLGYGNGPNCRLTLMHASSIDPADLEQVREAMQLLKRMIAGEPVPTSRIYVAPSRIVERRSTDVLAVSDPMVARALRFIWENIQTNPSVEEVATALDVQRRSLERGFRNALGCGIKAEIMRRRLQIYCRLLRSSDEPIVDLSAKMGYRSLESMHRQFRKVMGTTPAAYRRARQSGGGTGEIK